MRMSGNEGYDSGGGQATLSVKQLSSMISAVIMAAQHHQQQQQPKTSTKAVDFES